MYIHICVSLYVNSYMCIHICAFICVSIHVVYYSRYEANINKLHEFLVDLSTRNSNGKTITSQIIAFDNATQSVDVGLISDDETGEPTTTTWYRNIFHNVGDMQFDELYLAFVTRADYVLSKFSYMGGITIEHPASLFPLSPASCPQSRYESSLRSSCRLELLLNRGSSVALIGGRLANFYNATESAREIYFPALARAMEQLSFHYINNNEMERFDDFFSREELHELIETISFGGLSEVEEFTYRQRLKALLHVEPPNGFLDILRYLSYHTFNFDQRIRFIAPMNHSLPRFRHRAATTSPPRHFSSQHSSLLYRPYSSRWPIDDSWAAAVTPEDDDSSELSENLFPRSSSEEEDEN